MSDPVSNLLSRLEKVRQSKPNTWQACCPAHDDRNPSLSISRGDDGRVLLKCWAGCTTEEVVKASGIELKDLFTDCGLSMDELKQYRKLKSEREYFQLFDHELTVICQAVNTRLYSEQALSDENEARERLAAKRVKRLIGLIYE